ncbi:MAG: hypothetical protein AB1793_09475 [Candidatus Thermoplasmatota archaeon]
MTKGTAFLVCLVFICLCLALWLFSDLAGDEPASGRSADTSQLPGPQAGARFSPEEEEPAAILLSPPDVGADRTQMATETEAEVDSTTVEKNRPPSNPSTSPEVSLSATELSSLSSPELAKLEAEAQAQYSALERQAHEERLAAGLYDVVPAAEGVNDLASIVDDADCAYTSSTRQTTAGGMEFVIVYYPRDQYPELNRLFDMYKMVSQEGSRRLLADREKQRNY